MDIEVFADIWCPFAHVGIHAAFAARARFARPDVGIIVRSWPLELVNGAPMDPHKAMANASALREQVAPDLFGHVDPDNFPTSTIPALALAAAGYRRDIATGEALSLALRHALFEEGRNIEDSTVFDDIARRHGLEAVATLDDADVHAHWRNGQSRTVKGSPHFFTLDQDVFCPALNISRNVVGALELRRTDDVLERFLAESLT
jgi:predicted DsbA family dithiol-disulfide isomerase